MSIRIKTDYSGANINVLSKDCKDSNTSHFLLTPDLRDTTEQWFYWNFQAEGDKGQSAVFEFDAEYVSKFGPCISKDGINWAFSPDKLRYTPKRFEYTFLKNGERVWFAFSIPYQLMHFELFLDRLLKHLFCETRSLAQTKKGRQSPILIVGDKETKKRDVIFSCRSHACESVASYALEGVAEYIAENYGDFKGYKFHFLPFTDLDGVEDGDQGKSRAPHDHNRDYSDEPLYPTVKAWMNYLKGLDVVAGFDFHCPWKWGWENDHVFAVHPSAEIEHNNAFLSLLKANTVNSPLKYEGANDIKTSERWNFPGTKASDCYVGLGARLVFTLEIPYFGNNTMNTVDSLREFGASFARSLKKYLSDC